MASTSLDSLSTTGRVQHGENILNHQARTEMLPSIPIDGSNGPESEVPHGPEDLDQFKPHLDKTHRRLKPRHIQLIGIGGCVDGSYHQVEVVNSRTLRSI